MSVSAGAIVVSATMTIRSLSAQPASAAANSGLRYPPTQRKTPDAMTPTTATAATMERMSARPGLFAGAFTL